MLLPPYLSLMLDHLRGGMATCELYADPMEQRTIHESFFPSYLTLTLAPAS